MLDNCTHTKCVDLRIEFGNSYRVENELGGRRVLDPWLAIIPCRNGHIFPYGGSLLGASTNHRGPIANKLASLDYVEVFQDGDDGINFVFDVANFQQVAQLLRPRTNRRLSEEHRRKLVAGGARSRFKSGSKNAQREQERPIGRVNGSSVAKAKPAI